MRGCRQGFVYRGIGTGIRMGMNPKNHSRPARKRKQVPHFETGVQPYTTAFCDTIYE
jgi:hypothetical protein